MSFVNVTLAFAEHVPLVTVHFNVAGVPATTPVTVETFEEGVVIVTPVQPLVQVQRPVPVAGLPAELGLLPAKVNEPLLHCA